MNYETFMAHIRDELKSYLDRESSEYTVNIRKVLKNNGVELDALTVVNMECKAAPTIYLNGYYKEFNEGKSIEEIAEEIYGMFKKNNSRIEFDTDSFCDYEKIKGQIVYKVINAKKNGKLLRQVPHIKKMDMALVFYCILKCNKYENATTLIYNQHLDLWKVSAMDIYQTALENTPKILPYEIKSMAEIVGEILGDDFNKKDDSKENVPIDDALTGENVSKDCVKEDCIYGGSESEDITDKILEELSSINQEPQMYVLTNIYKLNGAATIFYKGVLKEFADRFNKDIIILPSSVHEVILIPLEEGMKMEDFKMMIREVNSEEVDPSEVLSDHAYLYRRNEDEIIM